MGRRTLVLVIALLLAGLAAYSIYQFLTNIQAEAEARQERRLVYRAGDFIPEGTGGDLLQSQNRVVESEEAAEWVPVNSIGSLEELQATLANRVAAGPISQGQIITADQWIEVTIDITPLAEIIPQGKQAISLQTDIARGVAGLVEPGDRVNLLVTVELEFRPADLVTGLELGFEPAGPASPDETVEEPLTKTITRFVLQGLPVLAVGRDIRPSEDVPDRVEVPVTDPEVTAAAEEPQNRGLFTLEVTPQEAERLVFALEQGSVWFTLVPEDFVVVPTDGVIIENLFEDLGILEDIFAPQSQ